MNTGIPAVSGEGAMGAVKQARNPCALPINWPAHRAPTPEEHARIQAAIERRQRLMENAQ